MRGIASQPGTDILLPSCELGLCRVGNRIEQAVRNGRSAVGAKPRARRLVRDDLSSDAECMHASTDQKAEATFQLTSTPYAGIGQGCIQRVGRHCLHHRVGQGHETHAQVPNGLGCSCIRLSEAVCTLDFCIITAQRVRHASEAPETAQASSPNGWVASAPTSHSRI